jgi:hypothetical protein
MGDDQSRVSDFLYVPPIVGKHEESKPLEEVNFKRDDVFMCVWADEHTVLDKIGNPVNGLDYWRERSGQLATSPKAASAFPRYLLAEPVDGNLFPFLPEKLDQKSPQVGLYIKEAPRDGGTCKPYTKLLNMYGNTYLHEESIPRTGIKIVLTRQRMRWIDGKTYVWTGRKVTKRIDKFDARSSFDTLMKD